MGKNKKKKELTFTKGELKTAFEQARCNSHSFDEWFEFNYNEKVLKYK